MDPTITAAIIAGVFSILAVFLTLYGKSFLDNKAKPRIDPDRAKALSGNWTGEVTQPIDDSAQSLYLPVAFSIQTKKNTAIGQFSLTQVVDNETFHGKYSFSAELLYSRYLHLHYKSDDCSDIQFGSCLLELDDVGKTLEGKFVGYGKINRKIVSGSVCLTKSP